jgi:hypothetical protein
MSCAAITTRPSPTPATPEHPHPRRPAVSRRVGHVLACGVAAGAPCAPRWCVAGGPAPAGGIRRAPVTAFDTFTTAIYDQFQSTFNGAGATMLAGVLVLLCLALLGKRGVGGRPRPRLPCRLRRCPPGPFRSGSVPPPFPRRGRWRSSPCSPSACPRMSGVLAGHQHVRRLPGLRPDEHRGPRLSGSAFSPRSPPWGYDAYDSNLVEVYIPRCAASWATRNENLDDAGVLSPSATPAASRRPQRRLDQTGSLL